MHPLLEKHRSDLRSLASRYRLSSLRVFGSMARGDASDQSDVDFLIESEETLSGFTIGALLMDAEEMLGRKVDVVTLNALHPKIRDHVLKEAEYL
jgi:predicted nucleotidyltransferase